MTDWFTRISIAVCAALTVAVVSLLGYAIWYEANDPGHGTITGKEYQPAWMQMSCTGKPLVCVPINHPECYQIRYTDGHHDGDACVSPQEYERYEVGGQYPAVAS